MVILKDGTNKDFWRNFVVPAVKRIQKNCQLCGEDGKVVHHTSYEEVNINTLKLLCRPCHSKVHRECLQI